MASRNGVNHPSERLRKLLVDVPKPYVLPNGVSIPPLTKRRNDIMSDALSVISAQGRILQAASTRSMGRRPEYPPFPAAPEPPAPNAKPAQVAVYEKTIGVYEQAVREHPKLVAEWETQVQVWDQKVEAHNQLIDQINTRIEQEQARYEHELFGPVYEEAMAYLNEVTIPEWNAIITDIRQEFGLDPKPNQLPDNGQCPACGSVVDEEQAGKAPKSSTSSKTIGTRSKKTSVS